MNIELKDNLILVIDDNAANVRITVDYLHESGFETNFARNGKMGLKRAEFSQPDLILLDVLMPGIDGFETCRQLKANKATRHIPVIFMTALADIEDKIKGFAAGGVDYVTKPIHQEELLARVRIHLMIRAQHKQLQQQAIELKHAKELAEEAQMMAEKANQSKSTFLSNMSHELRTPLNSILGFTQILQQQSINPKVDKRLGMIGQSGQHLLTLINDILDLSKIEARKLELYPQPIHLSTFLETITHIIYNRTEAKGLQLTYEADDDLPSGVQADETRLRQVLLNLLGNAVKFTDAGQVTLRVKRLDTPPAAGHPASQAQLRFEVKDTGVGMTVEQMKQAFQPFEQVGDISRRNEGTGLGLTISRQLVQLMGGNIHVESPAPLPITAPEQQSKIGGPGCRFWFEMVLPVTEAALPGEIAPERIISGYQGPQLKVLVADDIASNRAMLVDLLAPLGFEVLEAENGRQAIDLAQATRPDLMLMDRRMPAMDGLEAIRHLRQIPELQETPIISVSASVSEDDKSEIMAAGYTAFLPKPINWPDLVAQLEAHLSLEWLYEKTVAEAVPEAEIVLPPRADLEVLYELAQLGRMTRIMAWTEELAERDARYQPLAHKLDQLAGDFEIDHITQLARQYLEQIEE